MFSLLLTVLIGSVSTQLVVNTTLPNKEDYAALYQVAVSAYFDENDYTKAHQYLELAIADKRYDLRECINMISRM